MPTSSEWLEQECKRMRTRRSRDPLKSIAAPELRCGPGEVRIPLNHKGWFAKIDDADFERVSALHWSLRNNKGRFYVTAHVPGSGKRGKKISMHGFIIGAPPRQRVDHWDGDGLNNTRKNLRRCTNAENIRNSKPYRNRDIKGVTLTPRGWRAQICVNYKKINLGDHASRDSAARAYDAAARLYFGEFARTNFPPQQPTQVSHE